MKADKELAPFEMRLLSVSIHSDYAPITLSTATGREVTFNVPIEVARELITKECVGSKVDVLITPKPAPKEQKNDSSSAAAV